MYFKKIACIFSKMFFDCKNNSYCVPYLDSVGNIIRKVLPLKYNWY